jgi:hypothetical protein
MGISGVGDEVAKLGGAGTVGDEGDQSKRVEVDHRSRRHTPV